MVLPTCFRSQSQKGSCPLWEWSPQPKRCASLLNTLLRLTPQEGEVDRGADISPLSYYPEEREKLYGALAMMQVLRWVLEVILTPTIGGHWNWFFGKAMRPFGSHQTSRYRPCWQLQCSSWFACFQRDACFQGEGTFAQV